MKLWSGIRFEFLLIYEETRESNLCWACKERIFAHLEGRYDDLTGHDKDGRQARKEQNMYYLHAAADCKGGQRIVCEPTPGYLLSVSPELAIYRMRKEEPDAYELMKGRWAQESLGSEIIRVLEGSYTPVDFHLGRDVETFVMMRYQAFLDQQNADLGSGCSCPDVSLARNVRKSFDNVAAKGFSSFNREVIWAEAHIHQWLAPNKDMDQDHEINTFLEKEQDRAESTPVPILVALQMFRSPAVQALIDRQKLLGKDEVTRMEEQLVALKERESQYEAHQQRTVHSLKAELVKAEAVDSAHDESSQIVSTGEVQDWQEIGNSGG